MTRPPAPRARQSQWQDRVVLVVSPTPTHPQDYGNRKRIFRICKMLQDAGAKIHFVHYPAEAEWRQKLPARAQAEMTAAWDGYYLVPPTGELHAAPVGSHHMIDEWSDPQLENTVQWLSQKIRPNVAIVNYSWLSRTLDLMPADTLKILDTHDKFSGRKELLASYDIAPEFFYTTEVEEAKALARADIVWAIKEEERLLFQAMTDRKVVTVPHADPATILKPRRQPAERADFELRIGVMAAKNSINTRNLTRFLKPAGQIFRTHLPPLKIVIGGTICELLEDVDLPFVEKLGWVEDVEEFYRQIDVALVPMEFSTGLKIKTSEAMTYGLPIIAHEHAYEGYRPFHPYHALTSFKAIAEACADLAFQGPEGLEPLRQATASSHRAVIRATEAGIAATGAAIAEVAAYTLVLGNPGITVKGSVYEQLSQSVLQYLSFRGPLALYLDDIREVSGAARFCRGLPVSQIYVNPAVRDRLVARDAELLADAGIRWCGIEPLLSRLRVKHLWLDWLPEDLHLNPSPEFERVYLNLAMLRRADLASVMNGDLRGLAGPFTAVSILADSDGALVSRLRRHLNVNQIGIAAFWGHDATLVRTLTPPPFWNRYGVTMILEKPSEAITGAVAAVAAISGQKLVNIVVLNSDRPGMETLHRNGTTLRCIPATELDRRTLGVLKSTRVTVNFAATSLFAKMLVTALDGAGHETMTIGEAEDKSLLAFMHGLDARLRRPPRDLPQQQRQDALFNFDPGWSLVWAHNQDSA